MATLREGDPLLQPFWDAARRGELIIQRCASCGAHQFYPRPFCLACDGPVEWVTARGTGRVYSCTTVRIPVGAGFEPPYVAAIVQLDEGPRLLTGVADLDIAIDDMVTVGWRDRADGPPVPIFHRVRPEGTP